TPSAVEEARVAVARAEIAVREAERARDAASSRPADLEVQRAQLALDEANDAVAQAQAATHPPPEAAARGAAGVRAAERKVAEATIRRDQLQADLTRTAAARDAQRQRA